MLNAQWPYFSFLSLFGRTFKIKPFLLLCTVPPSRTFQLGENIRWVTRVQYLGLRCKKSSLEALSHLRVFEIHVYICSCLYRTPKPLDDWVVVGLDKIDELWRKYLGYSSYTSAEVHKILKVNEIYTIKSTIPVLKYVW